MRVWLAIGSLGVRADDGRIWNRSYLVDPEGEIRARYDKIHLFDVDLAGGESYRESATIAPGERAVVAETPFGGIGLSICYDLRFPQLYRALAKAGAGILLVPAAFTRTTGRAHWHVLLRARAIETGCFVVAASQCGEARGRQARPLRPLADREPLGRGPGRCRRGAGNRHGRARPGAGGRCPSRHSGLAPRPVLRAAQAGERAAVPAAAAGALEGLAAMLKTVRRWRPQDRDAVLALNAELQEHERTRRPSRRPARDDRGIHRRARGRTRRARARTAPCSWPKRSTAGCWVLRPASSSRTSWSRSRASSASRTLSVTEAPAPGHRARAGRRGMRFAASAASAGRAVGADDQCRGRRRLSQPGLSAGPPDAGAWLTGDGQPAP